MMGERTVMQEALFYGFDLEQHIPADHMLRSIDFAPPLGGNKGKEERNTGLGGRNHDEIQQSIAAGDGIDTLRDSLSHLYRSRFLH